MLLRQKKLSDNNSPGVMLIVNSARLRRYNAYKAIKFAESGKSDKSHLFCVK